MPECKTVRFLDGRKHKFRQKKVPIPGITSSQLYERKKQQRIARVVEIGRNPAIVEYINWIISIQKKLNLSNPAFAAKLGVTSQSVKLWKRGSGHFPSERTFRKLLLLEKESLIPFCYTKKRYGIKFR